MIRNLNIDYIGKKKIFFSVSIVLITIIALTSLIFGVLLDIQFKGGTIITYNYQPDKVNVTELQTLVEKTIDRKVSITEKNGINGADSVDIVLVGEDGLLADELGKLSGALTEKYGESISFLSNTSVNPIIGREFFIKSMVAVAFAAVILIIYIAFRFRKIGGWSAGVMAVVALLHDVIVVFGTFVIFRIPLDYNFIAVVLTILGYSINDTIVIYDRIRENQNLYGNRTTIAQLVNNSINETMARTINTTVSTLISLVVICIVALITGVSTIISFAFPMIIGMISGTYSTVFIAGPLWVTWQNYKKDKALKGKKSPNALETSK